MVPSSSEDIPRAMRGQLKPLCRNYLGRNGGNVIAYVLISFHSRDFFFTLSCLFVPPGFRWFCARLVVHYLGRLFGFRELKSVHFFAVVYQRSQNNNVRNNCFLHIYSRELNVNYATANF